MFLKTILRIVTIIIILASLLCVGNVLASEVPVTDPGSDADPIVSKSYVDAAVAGVGSDITAFQQKLDAMQALIESQTQEIKLLKDQVQSGGTGGSGGFQVVTLESGYVIYTGSGTEIVLRSGNAAAVKGQNGGMSDVTAAKDLVDGTIVIANHLLISSRDDNRGIRAISQCYLIVRGSYKIEVAPVSIVKVMGTVNANVLNVRQKADVNSAILTKIYKGEIVEILGKSGEWYNVTTSKNITGWSSAAFITLK
jgi:hypothetical protein